MKKAKKANKAKRVRKSRVPEFTRLRLEPAIAYTGVYKGKRYLLNVMRYGRRVW